MAIFKVTTAAGLQSALTSAVGGDRIVLSPGDYGSVTIQNRNYASTVTIQTSTPSNRAHLDGLFISKSSNLTISGLDLGRALNPGEGLNTTHLNTVKESANIRFAGVQIHGSLDGNPANDGLGLLVSGVSGLRLDNSRFTDLFRGVSIQKSSNATVLSNDFETIRSDGMTVSSTNTISIDRNSFTDFRPITGDHADAIQFWNTGQTTGSSNITIRNNVIAPGSDDYAVQGVWISDPGVFGYQNVKVTNNLVYSHGAYHGISVTGANGLQIANNTVLSQSTDSKHTWIRMKDSSSVSLTGNVTDKIIVENVSKLTQLNNHDLSAAPAFRDVIGELNAPGTLMDLIVAGVGFQAPTASAALTTLTADAAFYLGSGPIQPTAFWLVDNFIAMP